MLQHLRQKLPACITAALWVGSLYFAYLSGSAMSGAVGTTIESQDYQALSSLIGLPAIAALALLFVSRQSGEKAARIVKGIATFAAIFVFHVAVCFAVQRIASP